MNKIINAPDRITHLIIRLLVICIFLTGCTSLKPVDMNSKTLQENIRHGELIKEGDRVRVITRDGSSHILTVTAISEHMLEGLQEENDPEIWAGDDEEYSIYEKDSGTEQTVIEIQIEDIVLVEEEKLSAGKTTLAVGGGVGVVALAIFIIALSTATFFVGP